ncbi:MAG: enoyl-CoA hydratase/isomerase family protein, partial [Acidimicrobiales bacterium]
FTGDRVSAAVAVELGIANRVVAHDDLFDEAMALAQRIAAQPTFALRQTKRAVQLGIERSVGGVLEAAAEAERESMATDEHRARICAMEQGHKQAGE